jgi:NAD(P)-dependent dehydrogenase (short-subunit alcohol dehydrogenase family)
MLARFSGKVALVTGGATGIGKVTAQTFAREGAKVIVATDINIRGGEETVSLIKKAGGEAHFVKCDVRVAKDVEAMVAKSLETYGRLDYAFNNAGVGPDGRRVPVVNIVDCPEEIWDRTVDTNLKGVFLCLKYEMKQMLKQKHGAIVNTASVAGLKALTGFCAYVASKTGIIGLTKAAALEGAEAGVRVNAICPGPTERTLLFEYLTANEPGEKEKMMEMIPMKRVATPEDMAEAVMWLCSDAASFITGHAVPIDGGMASR